MCKTSANFQYFLAQSLYELQSYEKFQLQDIIIQGFAELSNFNTLFGKNMQITCVHRLVNQNWYFGHIQLPQCQHFAS